MVDVPGQVNAPSVEKGPVSLRESMNDFLKEEGTPAEATEETAPEGQEEEAEAATEDAAPPKEASEDDEQEETKVEGEKKPDDKKPNRYQRLKSQRDEAVKQVKESRAKLHEATVIANQWYAESKSLRDLLGKYVQEKGVQLDPRDLEVYQARRQLEDRTLKEKADETFQKQEQEAQVSAQREELKTQFLEESVALAEKYPGLTHRQILNAYAGVLEAEEEISMAEVAQNLAIALKKPARNAAVQAQKAANAAAPRPLSSAGRSAAPKYGSDTKGMAAYLKSLER